MDHRNHHHFLPPPPHPHLYFPNAPPRPPPPPPISPPSQLFRPPPPPPRTHQTHQFRPNNNDRTHHSYPVPDYRIEPPRIPTRQPVGFDNQRVQNSRPIEFVQRLLHSRPINEFDQNRRPIDHQRLHQRRPIEFDHDHQRIHHHRPIEFDQDQGPRLHNPRPVEFVQDQGQRLHQPWPVNIESPSSGLYDSAKSTFRNRFEFECNPDEFRRLGSSRELSLNVGSADEFRRLGRVGFDYGSGSSREFGIDVGSYDHDSVRNCRRDGTSEMQRFDRGDKDGVRVFSAKDEYYSSDMGRYNNTRGGSSNRDDEENKHTPKKKSAFLRIQMGKPAYRNRDDDRLRHGGYSNSTNVRSPYKGKGHLVEKRSGSPVDLDVSFKSNALVAKAMSSVPSEAYLTHRDAKIRKVMDSSRDSLNVLPGLEGFTQSAKYSEDKVKDSGVGNMVCSGSHPGSSKTSVPTLRSVVVLPSKGMVSDKGDNNTGTSSSSKVKKKKKKKIVKKVIFRPRSSTLSSTKKPGDSVVVDSSTQRLDKMSGPDTCTIPIKEKNIFSGNVYLGDVNLQPGVIEKTLSPDMNKVDGSSQATAFVDCGTDVISGMESEHDIEIVKNNSDVASSSLNGGGMDAPNISAIADISSCGLAATSKFIIDPANLSFDNMKPAINGMECVTKQFIMKGDPLAYENTMEEEPKTSLSREGNTECGSSSSENANKNSCYANNKLISDLGFEDGPVDSIEENVISYADTVGNGSNNPCIGNFNTLVNTIAEVEISKSNTSSLNPVALLCSEETRNHQRLSFADDCNHRSGTTDFGNTSTNLGGNPIPIGGCNYSVQQQPTTPYGTVLEGTNDDSVPTNTTFRNEVGISRTDDVCFGASNVANPSQEIDTTLNIFVRSPSPSEAIVSGLESMSADLQPSRDRFGIFHWNNSADLSRDKVRSSLIEPDGCSSGHETGLKDSASGLGSSTAIAHDMSEGDASVTTAESPSDDEIGITQPKEGVAATATDSREGPKLLLGDSQTRGSSEDVALVRHDNADDNLKLILPCIDSYSFELNLSVSDAIPYKEQASLAVLVTDQGDEMDMDDSVVKKLDLPASDEGIMAHSGIALDLGCESYLDAKTDFPSESNNFYSFINAAMAPKDDINKEVEHALDKALDLGSPETPSHVAPMQFDYRELTSRGKISGDSVQEDEKEPEEKQDIGGERIFSLCTSSPPYSSNTTADHAVENDEVPSQKTVTLFPSDSKSLIESLDCASGEKNQVKIKPSHSFSKAPQGRNTASSTHVGKTHTWHRDEIAIPLLSRNKPSASIIPMQKKFSPDFVKMQSTSYIRKGNSLVRNAARPATLAQYPSNYQMNPSLSHGLKKITTSENKASKRTGDVDSLDIARRVGVAAPSERPRTPPLLSDINALPSSVPILSECTPSSVEESPINCCKSTSDRTVTTETNIMSEIYEDVLKTFEASDDQINSVHIRGSQNKLNNKDSTPSIGSVIYVKRKSNQLVAASSSGDLSVQGMEKSQALLPDSYYKKSKNQLIRSADCKLNFKAQRGSKVTTERNCGKNHLHKAITKRHKMSKLPLVWTLCGTLSSKSDSGSLHCSSVFPNLFPWKRATYRRSFMQNSTSLSNKSFSTRKLLLSRKMDMVYTRSAYGYSIRKSKVLSIGGSNLKWSKSMEKRSKISNKEATLAAAAAETKKKENNGSERVSSGTKNRGRSSRERIFRIGSFRYKMDPSKRTLQRIPDDESTETADCPLEKNAKKSYVPRRLVIGSDEYVRIGNGNQLVRDPKKRLRVLASEKVRWSLHTVRQRLAKKRKYCQFFTRFGKCNKDDGKCPYIHDYSKVAVCTKFLNGLCSDPNCKLTHKVIPERMPDCSYFLQGLCANKDCPYRHVNVNPDASTCEGFLKGYCADGDECRKKHSYVCPSFEVTGSCSQGSKCKLHHPNNRRRGKKRKRSGKQEKSSGRYFGPMDGKISEHGTAVMGKNLQQNDDDDIFEGSLPDYIPLDVSSDDGSEKDCKRRTQMTYFEDLEEMIKLPQPKLIHKDFDAGSRRLQLIE